MNKSITPPTYQGIAYTARIEGSVYLNGVAALFLMDKETGAIKHRLTTNWPGQMGLISGITPFRLRKDICFVQEDAAMPDILDMLIRAGVVRPLLAKYEVPGIMPAKVIHPMTRKEILMANRRRDAAQRDDSYSPYPDGSDDPDSPSAA